MGMLMGQRIVGINGEDVSTWTFREIVTKCLHRAHRNSIDLEKVMNDDGEDGGNGVNRGNENEEDQIPEGRVVLTMRDPDVWSFQHARDLDLSPVELEALHPLSKCAPDIAWQTPLHVACSKGHTAV